MCHRYAKCRPWPCPPRPADHTFGSSAPRRAILAFTFVELVIVIAITGMLAAVAVPRVSSAIANHHLNNAAQRIITDVAYAQRRARTGSMQQQIVFDAVSNTYSLPGVAHLDRSAGTYAVDLADEPYGAEIVEADFDGDETLTFDGYGVPDSGGWVIIRVGPLQTQVNVDAVSGKATRP